MIQDLAALFGYQDQIFDANTGISCQIDTRLNGEDHAGLGQPGVHAGYVTKLMAAQTNEVTQTVVELGAVALIGDEIAGDVKTLRNIVNIMASKEDLLYKALDAQVHREHYCK